MPKRSPVRVILMLSLGLGLAILSAVELTPELFQQNKKVLARLEKLSFIPAINSQTKPQEQSLSSSEFSDRQSFLTASNLLDEGRGEEALRHLQDLETSYKILAPYVLWQRGKAYQLAGKQSQAEATWQKLIATYPDAPIVAEALYHLGKFNSVYWQQAIEEFPYHPRTQQIARQLLQQNLHQPEVMLLLAKYAADEEDVKQIRDSLVKNYSSQLTSADWEAIADGYWQKWDYGKAGKAYLKAPATPQNLYRAARGLHLGNDKTTAKTIYLRLWQEYPQAAETGLGLRRLASITSGKEALGYLDAAIENFPQDAPQALLEKAELLDTKGSPVSATQARQQVLTQYTNSEAAAEYRWQVAQQKAQARDFAGAWQWAYPITNNPESSLAPKASFWVGKWANKVGRKEDAKIAFKAVMARYPRSYYAWRSAVALGLNVGNFTNVRQVNPAILKPERSLLATGSSTFQELYLLGLNDEAYAQFRADLGDRTSLTVAEQFTDGLLKLARGKHLLGINRIWNLQTEREPQARQQWQALRQTPEYWQALFPFLYDRSIIKWSQQRQLNPLLVTSLIRQESRFEPQIRSSAGAVGLMQVMPSTAEWVASQIELSQYSLTNPEDNINLGTFYLDYTHRKYDNNSMLAVASYNAGPHKVAEWVEKYSLQDPDEFVENIPYPETRGYVESVFENYWNYLQIYSPELSQ